MGYQAANLLNPSLVTNEFIPAMFDTTRRLQLQHGATLAQEEVVHGPKTWLQRSQFGYPEKTNAAARYSRSDAYENFGCSGFWYVDVSQPVEADYTPKQRYDNVEQRRFSSRASESS